MATQPTVAAIETARNSIKKGQDRISTIRKSRDTATVELEAGTREVEDALESALSLIDGIAEEQTWWTPVRRFIRRVLSREFIISVLAIVAIWTGDLSTEQAIGVAVAGSGLALGRGVAKARTGGSDS